MVGEDFFVFHEFDLFSNDFNFSFWEWKIRRLTRIKTDCLRRGRTICARFMGGMRIKATCDSN